MHTTPLYYLPAVTHYTCVPRYDWRTPNVSICDVPNSECMGLVTGTGTLTKTPAYFAVQALARQLQGLAFVAAQPVCVSDPCQPSSSDFSISLMNATHSAIVVWSTLSFPHNVQLLFAAGCYDAADWMGQPLPQLCAKTSYNTHLNVMVEDSPVYLTQLTKPKHELKTIKSDDGADLMTAAQRAWLLAAARVPKPDAATWPPMSAAQDAQLLTAVEAFGTGEPALILVPCIVLFVTITLLTDLYRLHEASPSWDADSRAECRPGLQK